jgi:hypothetical protein
METCYKVFRREVIQAIHLQEDRFGFEPEVTVKIARRRLSVYEVGISYSGLTYEEGKKLDGRMVYVRSGVWPNTRLRNHGRKSLRSSPLLFHLAANSTPVHRDFQA